MSATTIAETIAATQGWTDTTLLDLTLAYIENQDSPDAFEDFLRTIADEENGDLDGHVAGSTACGLCAGPMIDTDGDGIFYCAQDCQEPEDPATAAPEEVVVTVSADQARALVAECQAAADAALGDSNDAEIQMLREALESALALLGLTMPDPREEGQD